MALTIQEPEWNDKEVNDSIDQIIYALQRAKDYNERLAEKLHCAHDFAAEIPASDAEHIQKAIDLLEQIKWT